MSTLIAFVIVVLVFRLAYLSGYYDWWGRFFTWWARIERKMVGK